MMALHDGCVRAELAECGQLTTPSEEPELIRRVLSEGFRSVTPNGILGDARGATAELGEKMIAALADRIAAHFAAHSDAHSAARAAPGTAAVLDS